MNGIEEENGPWVCDWCDTLNPNEGHTDQTCLACSKHRLEPVWHVGGEGVSADRVDRLILGGNFNEVAAAVGARSYRGADNRLVADATRLALAAELANLDVYLEPLDENEDGPVGMGWKWPRTPIVGGVVVYLVGATSRRKIRFPRKTEKRRAVNLVIERFERQESRVELALYSSASEDIVTSAFSVVMNEGIRVV